MNSFLTHAHINEVTDQDSDVPIVVKIIGVGASGTRMLRRMMERGVTGVKSVSSDIAADELTQSSAVLTLYLTETGSTFDTKGNPERLVQIRTHSAIENALHGAHLVVILADMGDEKGNGAASIIADVTRTVTSLTIAFAITPVLSEDSVLSPTVDSRIATLAECADSLITVSYEAGLDLMSNLTSDEMLLSPAEDIVAIAVTAILGLLHNQGLVCIDFEDVRTVMGDQGLSAVGIASATHEERARKAAECTVASLGKDRLKLAQGVLVLVSAAKDGPKRLRMMEVNEVIRIVRPATREGSMIVFGTLFADLDDALRVIVVACGIDSAK